MTLRDTLAAIVEPQLLRSIGELGFLGDVTESSAELVLPVTNWPQREALEAAIRDAAPGVSVRVRVMNEEGRLALRNYLRGAMTVADGPGQHAHATTPKFLDKLSRTRVLGISSGKGGVGKSSVTVNLAVALAQTGFQVGVLDADVYGFSLPKMVGADTDPIILGDLVIPTLRYGVRWVSMGYFIRDDQPVIWRGPMLHKAVEQLVTEVWWDEPDFLLIDMPPGTGDVALTLSEVLPRIEMYVVTTPQAAARRVAQRSAYAARKLKLAVRGVIENMSYFRGDDGKAYDIFGSGGGRDLAEQLEVPLLGQVPLESDVARAGDDGLPVVAARPDSAAAQELARVAANVADAVGLARVNG